MLKISSEKSKERGIRFLLCFVGFFSLFAFMFNYSGWHWTGIMVLLIAVSAILLAFIKKLNNGRIWYLNVLCAIGVISTLSLSLNRIRDQYINYGAMLIDFLFILIFIIKWTHVSKNKSSKTVIDVQEIAKG